LHEIAAVRRAIQEATGAGCCIHPRLLPSADRFDRLSQRISTQAGRRLREIAAYGAQFRKQLGQDAASTPGCFRQRAEKAGLDRRGLMAGGPLSLGPRKESGRPSGIGDDGQRAPRFRFVPASCHPRVAASSANARTIALSQALAWSRIRATRRQGATRGSPELLGVELLARRGARTVVEIGGEVPHALALHLEVRR
jgi:hypothetical protein